MTILKQIFVLSILFLALPATTFAATISLHATPTGIGVGDVVRVSIVLDSTIATNVFSGTLTYPAELEPLAINDGGSIISLWITHPAVSATEASITFAGITPGGFSGNGGMLFSVLFRAKKGGTANVSLRDVEVLRNDGAGGAEPVLIKKLTLPIGPAPSGGYTEPTDQSPPESFTIHLGNDPQLFNGQNYLVFTTVDKSSGVDHYTIAESRVPSFLRTLFPLSWHKTAAGPYIIVDQRLTSTVYIKAVDRAGNERLSVFPPQHLFRGYEIVVLLAILIVFIFLSHMRWGRRFRKNP